MFGVWIHLWEYTLGLPSVAYYFRVTVTLNLICGLSFKNYRIRSIFPILIEVGTTKDH